tara:strand:- start:1062 stop:1922 length:861 start_codon:yes stop_codon:yes gene_type:complete
MIKKKNNNYINSFMKITAKEVNELRKVTGAGMMDCKKALVESDGNFDKAIENLRKKGQKVAANRADRASSEGVVLAKVNPNKTEGILFSLNCETDFVAKNDSFIKLANDIAEIAINHDSVENILNSKIKGINISDKLIEQTGVIGEKIEIGSFLKIKGEYVGSYIHAGNKLASLVSLSKKIPDSFEISKNISMQVAAMNPIALDEESVDKKIIDKENQIIKEQLIQEGKPKKIIENIARGKLNKFFKDNTLVNQIYIKESKMSVKDYINSFDKGLEIKNFSRLSLS